LKKLIHMQRIVFISALGIFLISSISCKNREAEIPGTEEQNGTHQLVLTREQFESSGMETGPMRVYDFADVVHASGYIQAPPQNRAKISAIVSGHVSYSTLLIGDKVKKGQILLCLENPEFIQLQQDYAEAAYQLTYLKEEYERQKLLSNENIASQKVFSKAESEYNSMNVKVEGLKKKLKILSIDPDMVLQGKIVTQINIYFPIDGYVTAHNLSRGMFVSMGDVLLDLIDNSHMHLELFVFESDAMKIKLNQKIEFRIIQTDKKIYSGEVMLLGKSVEGSERKVAVHGHIKSEKDMNLISGMYVEADIIVSERKSVGLPNEAIANSGGQSFVFVLKSNTPDSLVFEQRYVDIGRVGEELTEVFCENDSCMVLVKGAFDVAEGF